MPTSNQPAEDNARAAYQARHAARTAAITLARDAGAQITTRPMFAADPKPTVRDVEPLAGLTAARHLELAARHVTREYIRAARESGHDWHQISRALGLQPGSETGHTPAEAAHAYAAGAPGTRAALRYGPVITWTCRTCGQAITDHGPEAGPADNEHGHAENCARHAQAIAAWNAQWEAEP